MTENICVSCYFYCKMDKKESSDRNLSAMSKSALRNLFLIESKYSVYFFMQYYTPY